METSETLLWYGETGTPNELHHVGIKSVLYSARTAFQQVTILDTYRYGRMLVVDGSTQSAEGDEHIYHETLVHPPLIAHPAPRRVLVIGGGEGATLREVLRHPTIKRVVMVDLDRDLVEQCEKLLPEWNDGAFHDPRVELVFGDGQEFVVENREQFDVVIIDVCDAAEDSPARPLYTEQFYREVKSRLTRAGLLVVQAMELSAADHADHVQVHRALRSLFGHVSSSVVFIPSFLSAWGFVVANDVRDVARLAPATVDARLEERGIAPALEHYDGQTHLHMFALPKHLRKLLGEAGSPG